MDSCKIASIQQTVEGSDLVAIVSLEENVIGLFPDSIYSLQVHKVYKGRADYEILVNSSDYTFKKEKKYLVFARQLGHQRFQLKNSEDECLKASELININSKLIGFLDERWVSKCYSEELENKMRDKANTREFQAFCGCDGKTYTNFGYLLSSGITQYSPGDCNEASKKQ